MKLGLIGYGKMGKRVEAMATQRGHEIVCRIGSQVEEKDFASLVAPADVCLDFTHPHNALNTVRRMADLKKNLVMGTTGWHAHLDEVRRLVTKSRIGFIYAPNFAIGIHLFMKLVEHAAQLIDRFDEYDISGLEAHHNQKADHPSGAGHVMGEILLKHIRRKSKLVTELKEGPMAADEIHVASVRCGHIPGVHSVMFDSACDNLTITHTSRNRDGFALGAVKAAEWLKDKQGFFTLDDLFNEPHTSN